MSQNLTISETGLKLIKAFEGYRPVDRELISGQRIVGYGHRLYNDDAVMMGKSEAEATLLVDLEPFEDMINTEVHAPMTQSQFDALCSFAFNVGPKAFLQSDTLRALNNGRPLDAANGLDIWRKSEIEGKTYVVDALMRRRTAEKALFLRTKRNVTAGREDLPPVKDTTITGLSTEDALPVFTQSDAHGIVATAPYDAYDSPMRRINDGPAGALKLSERDIIENEEFLDDSTVLDFQASQTDSESENPPLEPIDSDLDIDLGVELDPKVEGSEIETLVDQEARPSPIAAAATDIVARLDALIEDADTRFEDTDVDWPESLITAESDEDNDEDYVVRDPAETVAPDNKQNIIDWNSRKTRDTEVMDEATGELEAASLMEEIEEKVPSKESKPIMVIDELAQDDAIKARTDSAAKYIETTEPVQPEPIGAKQGKSGILVLLTLGFLLVGLAGGAMMRGSKVLLGEWGPIISFTGFVIGMGLILAGVYSRLRMNQDN